jgi:2-methylcitrate dehydratase PrpD
VELRVHPLVLELTGNKTPRTGLQGKFSVYHAAGAALVLGRCGVAEFTDEVVRDPRVTAVRDRVSAVVDENIREAGAVVAIRLKDGRSVEEVVEQCSGSLECPLSDEDMDAKVHALADPLLGTASVEELIHACRNVAALEDAGALARAATPA